MALWRFFSKMNVVVVLASKASPLPIWNFDLTIHPHFHFRCELLSSERWLCPAAFVCISIYFRCELVSGERLFGEVSGEC